MSLVEKVFAITQEQMMELAKTIEKELKTECPKITGQAAKSIHIEEIDETHILVGSDNERLYFADQGNKQKYSYFGGKGNKLAPNYTGNGSPVLVFEDGSVHTYAHTYYNPKRQGFVKRVADRHR